MEILSGSGVKERFIKAWGLETKALRQVVPSCHRQIGSLRKEEQDTIFGPTP